MLTESMHYRAVYGHPHTSISAGFLNTSIVGHDAEAAVDKALAMTGFGITAHQSTFSNGDQMVVPQF